MSTVAKKEKRRVVPTLVVESSAPEAKKSSKTALKSEYSERTQNHFKTLYHKDVEEQLRDRAVKLGYEKPRKPRPASKKERKDHGTHHEHMDTFGHYVKHWTTMKVHSKGVTLYDYLRKNYDKHLYLSSATKRFRKL